MIPSLDIAALQTAYAEGTLKPADVIEAVYDRIAIRGERPVWITLVPKETALAKAAGASQGPLYGIPFAVKDNIDVAGLPTTCACPAFGYVPERSAAVVELLEAAGAVLIGKTNLDQFATGLNGTRSPYGAPASVFSAEHISGGSSSGSAVAVASGLVSFALGTDTAGSGRVPAAFNNIVGWKPTKGVISTRGLVPACRTQDAISIFALTVRDAAAVADVASSFDPEDAFAKPVADLPRWQFPAPLRIGVPQGPLEYFGDTEAEALYRNAVETLQFHGATVIPFDLGPFLEAARLLYAGPWVAERLAAIRSFAATNAADIHEVVRGIVLGAEAISAVDAFAGAYELARLKRVTEAVWQTTDAVLLPTTPTTYRIDELLADPVRLNSNLGLYTNFVNLLDLAAIAVPAGFRSNGLPAGVTLIGPALTEFQLAAAADRLHRAAGDLNLGATEKRLWNSPPFSAPAAPPRTIDIAVVGAHLTGQPLNWQLTERKATLLETTRTATGYRLFALPGTVPPKPGLVYDGAGDGLIEVELWRMDIGAFGSFVGLIPPPLGIGSLTLVDGRVVKGFICETYAVADAEEITAFGGWRAWRAQAPPPTLIA
jgi:allophanate hydrolase